MLTKQKILKDYNQIQKILYCKGELNILMALSFAALIILGVYLMAKLWFLILIGGIAYYIFQQKKKKK